MLILAQAIKVIIPIISSESGKITHALSTVDLRASLELKDPSLTSQNTPLEARADRRANEERFQLNDKESKMVELSCSPTLAAGVDLQPFRFADGDRAVHLES